MYQRGFAPLLVLIGIFILGIGGALVYSKQVPLPKISLTSEENKDQVTVSPSITPTPTVIGQIKLSPTQTKSLNPKVTPTTSLKPTSTPKPTPTSASTATPVPITKKNTCDVNVIYGKLDGTKPDPLLVTLVYSFTGSGNVYMSGAQWDFDGNGSWDTDLKQSNGTMEHTYNSGGIYNVRLQLQASDGSMTDVCSKSVSLAGAIDVSLKGQVYQDLNCNNSKDNGENGVSGVTFVIMSPDGLIYQRTVSDQGGNYSFSKKISVNDPLPLLLSPADYNYIFTDKTLILNSQNYSATVDLPLCSS